MKLGMIGLWRMGSNMVPTPWSPPRMPWCSTFIHRWRSTRRKPGRRRPSRSRNWSPSCRRPQSGPWSPVMATCRISEKSRGLGATCAPMLEAVLVLAAAVVGCLSPALVAARRERLAPTRKEAAARRVHERDSPVRALQLTPSRAWPM